MLVESKRRYRNIRLVEGLDLEGLVEIPLPASGAEIEAGVDIKVPCKGLLARIGRA
jgi:hypothetical protein